MEFQKIGVASDHAGKELRRMILEYAQMAGVECVDYGLAFDEDKSVDYPDYAERLAEGVSRGELDGAVAICGTGIGMAIAAGKFARVRPASVWDEYSCRMSRMHNDANVLCLGARALNHHRAVELFRLWLETPFQGDRHAMRLEKVREIEKKMFKTE